MTARCALYMGALKIFDSPWLRPQLLFPKFLMCFCSDRSYESAYKILKFVSLPVTEIIGSTQFLDTPTRSFLLNFSWGFVRINPLKVSAKFAVRSFIVDVLRSIYPRNCALFEESIKVSMDKLWDILNKFRGGHKWNMQISGRDASFQNRYQAVWNGIDNGKLTYRFQHISALKIKIHFHSASA